MTPETIVQLVQTLGGAGAVLVGSLFALRHLHAQLIEAHEKRIADTQHMATKLLEVVKGQHEDKLLLAQALDSQADATRELRMCIEHLLADRNIGTLPRAPRRG